MMHAWGGAHHAARWAEPLSLRARVQAEAGQVETMVAVAAALQCLRLRTRRQRPARAVAPDTSLMTMCSHRRMHTSAYMCVCVCEHASNCVHARKIAGCNRFLVSLISGPQKLHLLCHSCRPVWSTSSTASVCLPQPPIHCLIQTDSPHKCTPCLRAGAQRRTCEHARTHTHACTYTQVGRCRPRRLPPTHLRLCREADRAVRGRLRIRGRAACSHATLRLRSCTLGVLALHPRGLVAAAAGERVDPARKCGTRLRAHACACVCAHVCHACGWMRMRHGQLRNAHGIPMHA